MGLKEELNKQFGFKSLRVSSYLCFLYDPAILWRTTNPFGHRQSIFDCQIVCSIPIVRCSRRKLWGPMFPRQTTGSYVFRRREYSMWPGMRWQNNNTISLWIVHWCQLCSNHSFTWLSCLMSQECLCLPHCQQFASIFERGGKTVYGRQEMMQSEIRTNWKQLLMIGGAFARFELHQWSLVYLMLFLACIQIFGVWTKAGAVCNFLTS